MSLCEKPRVYLHCLQVIKPGTNSKNIILEVADFEGLLTTASIKRHSSIKRTIGYLSSFFFFF